MNQNVLKELKCSKTPKKQCSSRYEHKNELGAIQKLRNAGGGTGIRKRY